jgi:hypothetical protein
MSNKTHPNSGGFIWSQPKKAYSVRFNKDEAKLVERLSRKMRISQNQVFIEAIRSLFTSTFDKTK